jgi:osmotically inducible protein OsmC
MDRAAIATWRAVTAGVLTTDSGALIGAPFSSTARFGIEARPTATTPEELLGAAYASCFTMTLADQLASAGHSPIRIETEARVQVVRRHGFWEIAGIRVHCSALVPGIAEREFLEIAHAVRIGCPIATALRPETTLTVSLSQVTTDDALVPHHPA